MAAGIVGIVIGRSALVWVNSLKTKHAFYRFVEQQLLRAGDSKIRRDILDNKVQINCEWH